jgi:protease IV
MESLGKLFIQSMLRGIFRVLGLILGFVLMFMVLSSVITSVFTGAGTVEKYYVSPVSSQNFETITFDKQQSLVMIDFNGIVGGAINNDVLNEQLVFVAQNRERLNCDGLIIRINTPGGDPLTSSKMNHTIEQFKRKTALPVIVVADTICASGGYWIATAGDSIMAYPYSYVGSIGVISMHTDISKLIEKVGVNVHIERMADDKARPTQYEQMTDKDVEKRKKMLNKLYNDFVELVANKRGIEKQSLRNTIGSTVYFGDEAVDSKLIDNTIDNLYDIVKIAHDKHNTDKDCVILKLERNVSIFEKMDHSVQSSISTIYSMLTTPQL